MWHAFCIIVSVKLTLVSTLNRVGMPAKVKVNQYTLDGVYVKTWDSMSEIERVLGFGDSLISNCCKRKLKQSNNYQWKYASECDGTNNIGKIELRAKPKGWWTKERCFEAARQCETKTEFAKRFVQAYDYARKNDWLKDYTWFVDGIQKAAKEKTIWNCETAYAAAKECSTITEFAKKHPRAYQIALDNNLIDEWFTRNKKPNGHWNNYDNCYEVAMGCKTRSEFQHKHSSAWKYSIQNGWIDDYYWFERVAQPYTDRVHLVYGYFFNEQNTVYVGRTYKPQKRHHEHSTTDCPVNRFAKSHNTEVPQMTILEKELTWDESLIYEDLYVEQYKMDGWNIINTAKTGLESGGLGNLGHNRYSREYCWNCAMKYNKKSDFFKNDRRVYNYAYKHGWLNDYTWLYSPLNMNVNQYDLDGNFIKEFSSAKEAAQELCLTQSCIQSCCGGRAKSHKGFMFRYSKDCDGHTDTQPIQRVSDGHAKKINQYTLNGELIKTWSSAREIARVCGYDKSHILDICNKKGNYKTSHGYIWKYTDEYNGCENIGFYTKPKRKTNKSVLQFTKEGILVNEYQSLRDAERITGIKHNYISNCCKGKKHYNSAGGFIWRYADDETKKAV